MQFSGLFAPDAPSKRALLLLLLVLAIGYPLICQVPEGVGLLNQFMSDVKRGAFPSINPVLRGVILFLGLWPVVAAHSFYFDERKSVRWWFLAAFLFSQLGSVVPVLVFRLLAGPVQGRTRIPGKVSAWLESKAHIALFSFLWLLCLWSFFDAHAWHEFIILFRTQQETHLMTWSLFMWCALSSFMIEEDMRRRPAPKTPQPALQVAFRVPLINVLFHLWLRPKLLEPPHRENSLPS